MIDLSPALSPPTSLAAQTAMVPGSATRVPSKPFGQTLGAFLDASDAASMQATTTERQALADDGKDLPNAKVRDEGDEQSESDSGAALGWFPAFILPPVTTPADPTALCGAGTSSPVPATSAAQIATVQPATTDTATGVVAPHPGDALQLSATAPILPVSPRVSPASHLLNQDADESALAAPPVTLTAISTDPSAVSAISKTFAPAGQVTASGILTSSKPTEDAPRPAVADMPPVAAFRTDPASQAIAISAIPQPAGQVFAGAIATATSWRVRAARADEREPADFTPAFTAATPTDIGDRAIVQPTGDARNAALDLTRDTGLQHMIDRIETLRDDADSRDTRVRLTPDALGSVDIAVRQDGDRVYVRFTAEQDATRALIADAQPRLTELAAARGVRIGDTSVGTGTGTGAGSNGTPQQPQTQTKPRFARAPVPVATETDSITDQRLA